MNKLVNYNGLDTIIERTKEKAVIAKQKGTTNNASLRMHLKAISHLKHMKAVMKANDVQIELNSNYNIGVITEMILKALYLECSTAFEGRQEQKLETDDNIYNVRSSISSYSLCSNVDVNLPVLLYANGIVRIIEPITLQDLHERVLANDKQAKQLMKVEQSGDIKLKPSINLSKYAITNDLTKELESLLTL